MVDSGTDPREVDRQQQAARTAEKLAAAVQALTVGEVWAAYFEARRPHWGDRHYKEHLLLVKPGGVPSKRAAGGMTAPGRAECCRIAFGCDTAGQRPRLTISRGRD